MDKLCVVKALANGRAMWWAMSSLGTSERDLTMFDVDLYAHGNIYSSFIDKEVGGG